jgi:hypothetical protein
MEPDEPTRRAEPAWEQSRNEALVRRLARPLEQPGVVAHGFSLGLARRAQRMVAGLPLRDHIASHLADELGATSDRPPIVYAQPASAPDQQPAPHAARPQAVASFVPVVQPTLLQRAAVARPEPAEPPTPAPPLVQPVSYRAPVAEIWRSVDPISPPEFSAGYAPGDNAPKDSAAIVQPMVIQRAGAAVTPAEPPGSPWVAPPMVRHGAARAEIQRSVDPASRDPSAGHASGDDAPVQRFVLPAGRRVRRNDNPQPPVVAPNPTQPSIAAGIAERHPTASMPLPSAAPPALRRVVERRGTPALAPAAAPAQDERPMIRVMPASPPGSAPLQLSRRSEPPILAPRLGPAA